MLLKSKQRFRSERRNVFTEEIRKIALSSNDDKRMKSIDSVKTNPYGMSKDLIWERENIKRINIITKYKNFQLRLHFKGKQKNITQNGQIFLIIHIEY